MTISVPSYVIPGTYLENVRYLDSVQEVAGIELLFFLFDEETERLFLKERLDIVRYAGRFSFSVHMPDRILPEHRRIIEFTSQIADCYAVHEPDSDLDGFVATINEWRRCWGDRFYLENLIGRDFERAASALPDVPICFDTGHVLARGESPGAFAERYGERIREIHLHGAREDKDHQPFGSDETWFCNLLPFLRSFGGRLTIELFAMDDVRAVLDALRAHDLVEAP